MKFTKIGSDGRPIGPPTLAAFQDDRNGLMWAAEDLSAKGMKHKEAIEACAAYRGLGFSDWRLPTLDELETLRDIKRSDPAADPELGLKSAYYWSSDVLASSPGDCAWGVLFYYGLAVFNDQDFAALVRPVRSARASQ